jgi:hypothetical protein
MKVGTIYRIQPANGLECYVGSTFDELRHRFKNHKSNYKRWKDGDETRTTSSFNLFEKYGIENCKAMVIKQYEVEDRRHLEVYETLWIKKLKAINKLEPCGGLLKKERDKEYKKQYREANKEVVKKQRKQYYEANKEKVNEKTKQYREANREKINEKDKKYYEANKEKVKEKKKQYYEANKEKVNEKQKQYYEANKAQRKEYDKQHYQIKTKIKQLMRISVD